jgi:hypothetical protein
MSSQVYSNSLFSAKKTKKLLQRPSKYMKTPIYSGMAKYIIPLSSNSMII